MLTKILTQNISNDFMPVKAFKSCIYLLNGSSVQGDVLSRTSNFVLFELL